MSRPKKYTQEQLDAELQRQYTELNASGAFPQVPVQQSPPPNYPQKGFGTPQPAPNRVLSDPQATDNRLSSEYPAGYEQDFGDDEPVDFFERLEAWPDDNIRVTVKRHDSNLGRPVIVNRFTGRKSLEKFVAEYREGTYDLFALVPGQARHVISVRDYTIGSMSGLNSQTARVSGSEYLTRDDIASIIQELRQPHVRPAPVNAFSDGVHIAAPAPAGYVSLEQVQAMMREAEEKAALKAEINSLRSEVQRARNSPRAALDGDASFVGSLVKQITESARERQVAPKAEEGLAPVKTAISTIKEVLDLKADIGGTTPVDWGGIVQGVATAAAPFASHLLETKRINGEREYKLKERELDMKERALALKEGRAPKPQAASAPAAENAAPVVSPQSEIPDMKLPEHVASGVWIIVNRMGAGVEPRQALHLGLIDAGEFGEGQGFVDDVLRALDGLARKDIALPATQTEIVNFVANCAPDFMQAQFVLHFVGKNPDVQQKIVALLAEVRGLVDAMKAGQGWALEFVKGAVEQAAKNMAEVE